MSDHHDLTAAQDESVRELLASARHTTPIPADVVARLDERLAGLVAERSDQPAPVVTLASRRRRRASTALVAAAAAVVLGVGVTQVLPALTGSGSDAGSTSAGSADESTADSEGMSGAEDVAPESDSSGAGASEQSTEEKTTPQRAAADAVGALVSTSPLRPQLRAIRLSAMTSSFSAGPLCPVPGASSTSRQAVTFDGVPAVVVYGVPDAGRQQVDVHLCGDGEPVESVQLRTR